LLADRPQWDKFSQAAADVIARSRNGTKAVPRRGSDGNAGWPRLLPQQKQLTGRIAPAMRVPSLAAFTSL
jgi:hypothetical protein